MNSTVISFDLTFNVKKRIKSDRTVYELEIFKKIPKEKDDKSFSTKEEKIGIIEPLFNESVKEIYIEHLEQNKKSPIRKRRGSRREDDSIEGSSGIAGIDDYVGFSVMRIPIKLKHLLDLKELGTRNWISDSVSYLCSIN
jgi:hypothetical protein